MTKHTQGPWQIGSGGLTIMASPDRDVPDTFFGIGEAWEWEDRTDEMSLANARLMAAAPELLEALQEILAIDGHSSLTREDSDKLDAKARAAIAKATGGAA